MRLPYALRRFIGRVRTEGFWHTLWLIASLALEPWYEWRLGIQAFGPGKGKSFSIPTDHRSFRIIMRHVQVRPGQDVFMDYGCGRGRVLAMASTFPFKKIIGIEYSQLLSDFARENIKRINRRRMKCTDIEVITGDAGAYELPPEVTVAYFFDPFEEDVIRRVIQQIHRSLQKSPRNMTIIYYGPAWAEAFEECDWIVKVHDFDFPRRRCYIYETKS